ncbi:MAG TPA: RNA polymerase sigma factor [Sphingobacterium sp.]|nr:RNA polymerase sigma factor [Sphingobacterium sp.]
MGSSRASGDISLYLEREETERSFLRILPKYLNDKPLTLKKALEDCLLSNADRSQEFIYKRYYGYLMAVAIRYLKDEMEAEDVVNEAFVKVFRKIGEFISPSEEELIDRAFRSWIAKITVNTSIDKLRVRKETNSLDDIPLSDLSRHAVSVSTVLEEQDILKLLNHLPDIQRSIFNLYEIEGYSHQEISEMMSIPESTSRTYLTRAKVRLRKLYTDQLYDLQIIKHS